MGTEWRLDNYSQYRTRKNQAIRDALATTSKTTKLEPVPNRHRTFFYSEERRAISANQQTVVYRTIHTAWSWPFLEALRKLRVEKVIASLVLALSKKIVTPNRKENNCITVACQCSRLLRNTKRTVVPRLCSCFSPTGCL